MNFITKLFQDKADDLVHSQFVRYGIGVYSPKAVVKIKNGTSAKIVTSFEYVNDFLELVGEKADGSLTVNGKIFLKKKIDTPFGLIKKKGLMMGIVEEQKISPKTLKDWVNNYGREGYLLLNVTGDGISIKTKSAPHNPRGTYAKDFCKITVSDPLKKLFLQDLLFEIKENFKIAEIRHQFLVDDILIPKEYENNMELARIYGKRKGIIKRTTVIDGKEVTTEKKTAV